MSVSQRIAAWWPLVVMLHLGISAILAFFPRFGPPDFRYTGSDPSHAVWNLGWPLASMIHDPRSGLHISPLGLVVLPILVLALLVNVAIRLLLEYYIVRSRKRGLK